MRARAQGTHQSFFKPHFFLMALLITFLSSCGGNQTNNTQNPTVAATGTLSFRVQIASSAKTALTPPDQIVNTKVTCDLTLTDTEGNEFFNQQFMATIAYSQGDVPLDSQIFEGVSLDLTSLNLTQPCFTLDVSCVKSGTGFPFDFISSWAGTGQFCGGKDIDTVITATNIFDLRNDPEIQALVFQLGCPTSQFLITTLSGLCSGGTNFCKDCPEGQCLEIKGTGDSVCTKTPSTECPAVEADAPAIDCSHVENVCVDAVTPFLNKSFVCNDAGCCVADGGSSGSGFGGFLCTKVLPFLGQGVASLCSPSTCKEGETPCDSKDGCTAPLICQGGCCTGIQSACPPGSSSCANGALCPALQECVEGCCSGGPGTPCPDGISPCIIINGISVCDAPLECSNGCCLAAPPCPDGVSPCGPGDSCNVGFSCEGGCCIGGAIPVPCPPGVPPCGPGNTCEAPLTCGGGCCLAAAPAPAVPVGP